ncbi:NERD domain-containing protein [Dactylosporangium sp. NPDC049525]|uniref:NERD domain-containing protein n=1 Tax=Dactylosporangium sp. NPDC049525 TaxID=3154730 RepID=UPI0034307B26
MNAQLCEVFLGDRIDDHNERRFLRRLRVDLERRGCPARIYANFITRSYQRQVDFLVSTAHRLVHVELKTVDPRLPLVSDVNGLWEQQLPDGRQRPLERNFYRQAQQTTQCISDDMHDLVGRGEVPRPAGTFYSSIHTVICTYPDIPDGSQLGRHRYVSIAGYGQLLELLCNDGPRPAWSDEHWSAFARYLQLVGEPSDSAEEVERRASITALQDYCRRFVAAHSQNMPPLVPLPALSGQVAIANPLEFLMGAVAAQRTVVFVGPSGAGKSHAARHAAVAVAAAGGVPLWVRCGEYQRGRFSHALSRAVAPFTTEACLPLLRRVADTGSAAVVILDGLNECAPADRSELIEGLNALRLRWPMATIITSTEPVESPDAEIAVLNALLPDDNARSALLSAYGRPGGLVGAEAFRTPMELAMAVECGESLSSGTTPAELFDAYISRLCPAEQTRAGLRRLACEMGQKMRGSLSLLEARVTLHRGAGASGQETVIDAVLGSPLLNPTQGHVAFRHETLARFLAAEHLLLDAADSHALAEALRDPRNLDLHDHVVALEPDPHRKRDLLLEMADVDLLCAAVRGEYGTATAQAISTEVSAVLTDACAAVDEARLVRDDGMPDVDWSSYWTADVSRSIRQQALLGAAGACLADGYFLSEVGTLLDRSDSRCAEEMRRLRAEGHRSAVSVVVQATYGRLQYGNDRERRRLAVSVVVNGCERGWNRRRRLAGQSPTRILWTLPGQRRWGRLTAALLLIDSEDPADLMLLPDVFSAAWKVGGYHMRLTALTAAEESAYRADEVTRQRMRTALDECGRDSIMLNSLLFETLAAYDALEPLNTEESIRAQIAGILAAPADSQAWQAAQGMIGMHFEDQRLHGPYSEVISALEDTESLRLHVLAARSSTFPCNRDWIMAEIVERLDHADDDTREVLRDAVLYLDWSHPFRQEVVCAHLIALHGWARLANRLPAAPPTDDQSPKRAWRIVDELLFAAIVGSNNYTVELTALWTELRGPLAAAAVDVLAHLQSVSTWRRELMQPSSYERLLTTWPDQCRKLLEWCIESPDRITATFDNGPAHDARRHLVGALAHIGTRSTAELLKPHITDPDIGAAAVAAIRAIEYRIGTPGT